jgi:hypothetical protein
LILPKTSCNIATDLFPSIFLTKIFVYTYLHSHTLAACSAYHTLHSLVILAIFLEVSTNYGNENCSGSYFPGVVRPGCEDDNTLPCGVEV